MDGSELSWICIISLVFLSLSHRTHKNTGKKQERENTGKPILMVCFRRTEHNSYKILTVRKYGLLNIIIRLVNKQNKRYRESLQGTSYTWTYTISFPIGTCGPTKCSASWWKAPPSRALIRALSHEYWTTFSRQPFKKIVLRLFKLVNNYYTKFKFVCHLLWGTLSKIQPHMAVNNLNFAPQNFKSKVNRIVIISSLHLYPK